MLNGISFRVQVCSTQIQLFRQSQESWSLWHAWLRNWFVSSEHVWVICGENVAIFEIPSLSRKKQQENFFMLQIENRNLPSLVSVVEFKHNNLAMQLASQAIPIWISNWGCTFTGEKLSRNHRKKFGSLRRSKLNFNSQLPLDEWLSRTKFAVACHCCRVDFYAIACSSHFNQHFVIPKIDHKRRRKAQLGRKKVLRLNRESGIWFTALVINLADCFNLIKCSWARNEPTA